MSKYLLLLLVAAAFQAGDAMECYSCNATTPEKCDVEVDFSNPLPVVTCDNGDTCFSTLNGTSGAIEYGCKDPALCIKDPDCANCSMFNKCNYQAYKPFGCFKCSSEKDPFCGYDFQEDKVPFERDCATGIKGAFCYTMINEATNSIERGCTTYSKQCSTSEDCEMCYTDRCNGKDENNEVDCFQCDGIRNTMCSDVNVNETAKDMTVTCSNLFKEPLCYKWTRYGIAYRGCTARNTTRVCREFGMASCDLCDTNECNSSSQLGVSFIMYLLAPIIASIY